ncbi:MAG: hypothetical protein IKM44_03755 [Clostridia bacterium]|nr:hypothetical protein [Clostridia bacterium]
MDNKYFSSFSLRHVCDLTLVVGAVFLLVGIFVSPIWVSIVGYSLFIIGAGLSVVRAIIAITKVVSKKSPEFRNAIINMVIMIIVLGLSVFGLVYNIVVMA